MREFFNSKPNTPLHGFAQITLKIYEKSLLFSRISKLKAWKLARREKVLKLNIGSGAAKINNWINIDMGLGADLVLDVRRGLPFKNNSINIIYSEHFVEHLSLEEGTSFVRECFRCLKTGGVMRIATPDLDFIVDKYSTNWKNQEWLSWPEHQTITTKCRMINIAFRSWGHRYLYNEEDLKKQLKKNGFKRIRRCNWNESDYRELCNLETRSDSKLIIEALKYDNNY